MYLIFFKRPLHNWNIILKVRSPMEGRIEMKRIIFSTLFLFFTISSSVYAHTGLTDSSPSEGEVITEDIYEVILEFNTEIESTSMMKVINDENEVIGINILVGDSVMTGGFMAPLDNGTYTVEWKIIGVDGHPIQGKFSFTVKLEKPKNQLETENTEETSDMPREEVEEKIVEQPVEPSTKLASNDVLVVILVVLFTIAGGFFGWIIGRRQNK